MENISIEQKILSPAEEYRNTLSYLKKNRGKPFFGENDPNDFVRPFNEVYQEIDNLKIDNEKLDDNKLIISAPIELNGEKTSISSHIEVKHIGKDENPIIISIPGFGVPNKGILHKALGFSDYSHIGIEVFHNRLNDSVKVSSSIDSLQKAFALTIKSIEEAINYGNHVGKDVIVIGSSFGAKSINGYLNQAQNDKSKPLAKKFIAIQGGHFSDTFLGDHYRNKMVDPTIADYIIGSDTFPMQESLIDPEIISRTIAYINPEDNIALGQEKVWSGIKDKRYLSGSHRDGTLKNIFKLKKEIKKEL